MADAMDLKQSRKWMVTINNPEEHGFTHDRILEIMSSVRGKSLYWCMCDEEGDECETRHTHVFIYRSSPFTARQIDNLFPKMHRDVCYGKAQESRAYVLKDGEKFNKQEDGSYSYMDASGKLHEGVNFSDTFFEFGTCPEEHQGKSGADDIILELLKDGADNLEVIEAVVLVDGSIYSHTFTTPSSMYASNHSYTGASANTVYSVETFPGGYFRTGKFAQSINTKNKTFTFYDYLTIGTSQNVGDFLDIVYIELVVGDSTDLSVEKITAVYPSETIEPNTAAIQTTIPVNGYTVGGIRPTLPAKGDLWFPVMENRITSVQIYTGTHWEEVNARWYTGTRWIPIYAFDITTLEDLFDIADGDSVVPLLPDQNSFLRWWQLQWLDFRAWLENALSNSGSGGGTSLPDDDVLPGEDATDEEDGWSFIDLLSVL